VTVSPTGGSFGMNASNTNGSSEWTTSPSSIVTTGGLSINVGGVTTLTGSKIESQTKDMRFTTGSLVVNDLKNNDELHVFGGGFNAGFGTSKDKDGKDKTNYTGSVNIDIQDKDKEGIVRATIGGGTIEIGSGMTPDKAHDLLALLNRDPKKFVEQTKNQNDSLKADIDIAALVNLPENLSKLTKLLTALATPVPDDVKDQGVEAEKLFKRMLLSGVSPEKATALSETPEFEKAANHAQFVADKITAGQKVTLLDQALLASLEGKAYGPDAEFPQGSISVPCTTGPTKCRIALDKLKELMNDDQKKELIFRLLQDGAKYADHAFKDKDKDENTAQTMTKAGVAINILLDCMREEPKIFSEFVRTFGNDLDLLARGTNETGKGLRIIAKAIDDGISKDALSVIISANSSKEKDLLRGIESWSLHTASAIKEAAIWAAKLSPAYMLTQDGQDNLNKTLMVIDYIKNNRSQVSDDIYNGVTNSLSKMWAGDTYEIGAHILDVAGFAALVKDAVVFSVRAGTMTVEAATAFAARNGIELDGTMIRRFLKDDSGCVGCVKPVEPIKPTDPVIEKPTIDPLVLTNEQLGDLVARGEWVNPSTNMIEKMPAGMKSSIDHVFPQSKITDLTDYNKLTRAQQLELLNDPYNLQLMTQSYNSSKGAKVNSGDPATWWNTYKGNPVNPEYSSWLADRQAASFEYFKDKIKKLTNK
jgi:hypothetical protein